MPNSKLLCFPKTAKKRTPYKSKRTFAQHEHDLAETARLYLRGKTQLEIADELCRQYADDGHDLTLTQQQIALDIKEIHTRWINSSLIDFNQAKGKELARCDELERAYWMAWEKSNQPEISEELQRMADQIAFAADQVIPVERIKSKTTRKDTSGQVAFLQGIERCIDKRCKILGLFSPEKFTVDWRLEAAKAGITDEAASETFEKMVKAVMDAKEQALAAGGSTEE